MMIMDLPSDLIEGILFRVPTKSLGKSRLTCKLWNALVKDPRFLQKHFGKAPSRFLVVSKDFISVDYLQKVGLAIDYASESRNLINPHGNIISEVFHLEGFLLFTTKDKRLVVWNPCTGQTMWVSPGKPYGVCATYALGYVDNNLCRIYKILRSFTNFPGRIEIYEFSSDSWRELDDDVAISCSVQSRGVSLKGNIYWLALSKDHTRDSLLLSFDFVTERYQRLSLPFQINGYDTLVLSVDREERLSALLWRRDAREMEIWVSTRIETPHVSWSWSNFLKVASLDIPHLSDHTSFFIDDDTIVVACCGIYSVLILHVDFGNRLMKIEYGDLSRWPTVFNYVPSLVRIQQGQVTSGGKRKDRV